MQQLGPRERLPYLNPQQQQDAAKAYPPAVAKSDSPPAPNVPIAAGNFNFAHTNAAIATDAAEPDDDLSIVPWQPVAPTPEVGPQHLAISLLSRKRAVRCSRMPTTLVMGSENYDVQTQ